MDIERQDDQVTEEDSTQFVSCGVQYFDVLRGMQSPEHLPHSHNNGVSVSRSWEQESSWNGVIRYRYLESPDVLTYERREIQRQ